MHEWFVEFWKAWNVIVALDGDDGDSSIDVGVMSRAFSYHILNFYLETIFHNNDNGFYRSCENNDIPSNFLLYKFTLQTL